MKIKIVLPTLLLLLLLPLGGVSAQSESMTIKLSRVFGYSGFSNDIQGTFTIRASGPADLTRVDFYLDDTLMGTVAQAPFTLQFVTDNYPLGVHTFHAVGTLSSGETISSNSVTSEFVPASQGSQFVVYILGFVLLAILASVGLAVLIPILTGRKLEELAPGAPRKYTLGGAVCRNCGRPFDFHLYGLRLGFARLERCPYCGKWNFVSRAPLDQLRAAEQAEIKKAQATVEGRSEEEKDRKEIEESKYQDM